MVQYCHQKEAGCESRQPFWLCACSGLAWQGSESASGSWSWTLAGLRALEAKWKVGLHAIGAVEALDTGRHRAELRGIWWPGPANQGLDILVVAMSSQPSANLSPEALRRSCGYFVPLS